MSHVVIHKIVNLTKNEYSYIIMDTPPNPCIVLENSIYVSDKILLAECILKSN